MTETHPDDEFLSAHLDGEADAGPHLRRCAACRARLAAFAAVREAVVGLDDAPSDLRRAAAVRAGLDAAGRPRAASGLPRRWLAVAAATAVIAAAGPLVLALRDGDGGTDRATTLAAPGPVTDLGDLGDHAEAGALAAAVSNALTVDASATAGAGATGGATALSAQPATPDAERSAADDKAQEAVPPPAAAELQTGTAGASGRAMSAPAPLPACLAKAEAAHADGQRLTSRARARYRGRDAVVLVYEGGSGRRLVVLSSSRCGRLAERRF